MRPSTTIVGSQGTGESGVSPARSRANELTTLKVEPGAARPERATCWLAVPGLLAAARISPVEGRIATSAPCVAVTPASTVSAAVWASTSIVVAIGRPGTASWVKSTRLLALPAASVPTALIFRPGVPASHPSYIRCRPASPT